MKFSVKDFFSKCEQIRSFLRICSHLLKKFLTENFIFVQFLCGVSRTDFEDCSADVRDRGREFQIVREVFETLLNIYAGMLLWK